MGRHPRVAALELRVYLRTQGEGECGDERLHLSGAWAGFSFRAEDEGGSLGGEVGL